MAWGKSRSEAEGLDIKPLTDDLIAGGRVNVTFSRKERTTDAEGEFKNAFSRPPDHLLSASSRHTRASPCRVASR